MEHFTLRNCEIVRGTPFNAIRVCHFRCAIVPRKNVPIFLLVFVASNWADKFLRAHFKFRPPPFPSFREQEKLPNSFLSPKKTFFPFKILVPHGSTSLAHIFQARSGCILFTFALPRPIFQIEPTDSAAVYLGLIIDMPAGASRGDGRDKLFQGPFFASLNRRGNM